MPDQPTNRLPWERVPILGNNPVFCFEARRVWTGRAILLLLLVAIGLGFVSSVLQPKLLAWVRRLPEGPANSIALWAGLSMLPPPLLFFRRELADGVLAGAWGPWWAALSYLLTKAAQWGVALAARYFVPVVTALSLVDDRAAGRLEPLLVTRKSASAILIGKLLSPTLPLCLGLVGATVVFGGLAILGGSHSWLVLVSYSLSVLLDLLTNGMMGLLIGGSAKGRESAVAGSLLMSLVALPLARTCAWYALALPTGRALTSALDSPVSFWAATVAFNLLWTVSVFTALWYGAKRALTRAAE